MEVYDRSYAICRALGESKYVFQTLAGISTYRMVRSEIHESLRLSQEMLRLAEDQQQRGAMMEAERLIGLNFGWLGQFEAANEHLERVEALFQPEDRHRWTLAYGQDHLMSSLVLRSWVMAQMGRIAFARELRTQSLIEAERSGHAFSIAYALTLPLIMRFCLDEVEVAKAEAQRAIDYCTQHGIAVYQLLASLSLGWIKTRSGHLSDGIDEIRASIDVAQHVGTELLKPIWFAMLADALRRAGKVEEAHDTIEQAFALMEKGNERHTEAETWRLRGLLLLSQPRPDPTAAEGAFRTSIAIAQRQYGVSWELRSATDLARLLALNGDHKAARDILWPVLGRLNHEPDVPILSAARTLARELVAG
jgi:predicted ATPase